MEFFRQDELLNTDTVALMRWFAVHKLSRTLLVMACGRDGIDDLIQEAAIKLATCRVSHKYSYSTIVCRTIYFTALLMARKTAQRQRNKFEEVTDDIPAKQPDDQPRSWEINPDLLSGLTEREERVINLRFCSDATLKDIGEQLGISRQRIGQLEKQAIEKIRRNV